MPIIYKRKMRIWKSHPLLSLANGYLVDSPQPSNLSCLLMPIIIILLFLVMLLLSYLDIKGFIVNGYCILSLYAMRKFIAHLIIISFVPKPLNKGILLSIAFRLLLAIIFTVFDADFTDSTFICFTSFVPDPYVVHNFLELNTQFSNREKRLIWFNISWREVMYFRRANGALVRAGVAPTLEVPYCPYN